MGKMVAPGIEKLGRQKYRVWWTETSTGRRRSRVLNDTSLPEAKRIRAGLIDAQTRGVYAPAATITVAEWFDAWHARRSIMGSPKAPTLKRYRQLLNSIAVRLGDVALQSLTRQQIEGYYEWCLENELTRLHRLVTKETVYKRHKVLKQCLDDAVDQTPPIITINPAAKAAHPSPKDPDAQFFERDEAAHVLAALAGTRDERIAAAALHVGSRIGETLAFSWKNLTLTAEGGGTIAIMGQVVEDEEGVRVVPYAKTASSRGTVTFGVELGNILRAHRREQAETRMRLGIAWDDNDLMFCGRHGQPLRPSKVSAAFSAATAMLEDAGAIGTKGATFHTLRHTHATLLLRARVPVHIVSSRLRHKTVVVTLTRYAHVIPADDALAAAEFDAIMGSEFGAGGHAEATMHIIRTSGEEKRAAEATR